MARTGSLSSKLNVTCLITMELKGNRVLDGGGGTELRQAEINIKL